jgi:hypothetical protein
MKRVSIDSFPKTVEIISPEKTVNNSHLLAAIQCHAVKRQVRLGGHPPDERGQWLENPRHRDVHSAYAITGIIDGEIVRVMIDLTFIDENNHRWIIAMTTSSSIVLEEHRQPLEKAAKLLRNQEADEMWCGIYSTVSRAWAEWRIDN